MSLRAFAAHLGVAVATVTNWEQRGTKIRLRDETQEILDRDFGRLSDDVRARFEAVLDGSQAALVPVATAGDERLKYALAHPGGTDSATVVYLREQLFGLDVAYDNRPSASLLGPAGEYHGRINLLRMHATDSSVKQELLTAFAESATLMGQLVWDASLRRDHALAMSYFTDATAAASESGKFLLVARAQLRSSLVMLYGQKDPAAGLQLAARAAATSRYVSNALASLALLHVAEAHAMRREARSCEDALAAADRHFAKIQDGDEAATLISASDSSRMAGSCYLRLNNGPKATALLRDTLSHAGKTKAAAVTAANLALALARQHKVDAAVESLHRAIDIIDTTRGGGGLTVAFTAGRALTQWRDDPSVQDVHDRLLALMTA